MRPIRTHQKNPEENAHSDNGDSKPGRTAETVFSQLIAVYSDLNDDEQRKLRELIQDSSILASGAAAFMILERGLQNMAILPDAIVAKSRRATDRKNKKVDTHTLMLEIETLRLVPCPN